MYAQLVRDRWTVESQLHWQTELTSKEDQLRSRTGHVVLAVNILRKTALFLRAWEP